MKKYGRVTCQICGFDFGKFYGPEYANKIHFHHKKPLYEIKKEYVINPIKDLLPVCPNCHMVLHTNEEIRIEDLKEMIGNACLEWEVAFELRLKQSRHVRIYADVLIITENRVFSLEFKMKDEVNPEEVLQAAKYIPYLEILFGQEYEVIPVLVLTGLREKFEFIPLGKKTDAVLPVCSGDMLFNVFDEYIGFLAE